MARIMTVGVLMRVTQSVASRSTPAKWASSCAVAPQMESHYLQPKFVRTLPLCAAFSSSSASSHVSSASLLPGVGSAWGGLLSSSSSVSSSVPSLSLWLPSPPTVSSLFRNVALQPAAWVSRRSMTYGKRPMRLFGDDVWDLNKKIRRYKPVSPGLRHLVAIDRSELWRGRPVRALTKGMRKKSGRSFGRIVCRHRGGGHKRRYRFIDFKRNVYDKPGIVQRLEYDPNRTCYIALIRYEDDTLSYILAPHEIRPGDTVISSRTREVDVKPGNCMPLGFIPVGTTIHNLELKPGKGGQIARAAGTSCTLLSKNSHKPNYALVRLKSKEQRLFHLQCAATIGTLSNPLHKLRQLGKAGRARWMGRRPRVRGVAMNPVDHPMGGGEGKSSGGRHSVSKWGVLSKGFKTRNKRRKSPLVIVPVPDSRARKASG